MTQDKNTAMMKLADLLKKHKVVMKQCPEIIEIIEDLYVEIERQNIMDAFQDGRSCGVNIIIDEIPFVTGEQYYNETYG
jgi:hypothetical protein